MKKLKAIKSKLKKHKEWKKYKSIFIHRQTRFFVTKIMLVYKKDLDVEILYNWEKSFLNTPVNQNMFEKVFGEFKKYYANGDWFSFSKMLWYIYQISRYYKDLKNKIKNIYINGNIIELNKIKRNYYVKWLDSLNKEEKDFNNKIIEVNKIIF